MHFKHIVALLGVLAVPAISYAQTDAAPSPLVENKEAGWALRVYVEGAVPQMEAAKGLDVITTAGVTKDDYDVLVRADGGDLVLQWKGGAVARRIAPDKAADELRPAFVNLWRHAALLQLRNEAPEADIKVEVRVVPLNVTESVKIGPIVLGPRKDAETKEGRLVLRDDDYGMIELRNRSTSDVYMTVLDLSPDASIGQVFPNPGGQESNLVPADGNWHPTFNVIRFGPPHGVEVFKAIATRYYVDFRPLQAKAASGARGAPTAALGKLLLSSSTSKRTAPALSGMTAADWSTAEFTFEMLPKK